MDDIRLFFNFFAQKAKKSKCRKMKKNDYQRGKLSENQYFCHEKV